MTKNIINYIDEYFSFLIDELGFTKVNEEYDDRYLDVIFQSKAIRIEIEKYHRVLDMYVASTLDPEDKANLFNIIAYLNRNTNKDVKSIHYLEIENPDEGFKLQIKWLSQVLKEYYPLLVEFYNPEHYQENSKQLTDFVIKRNPELFRRIGETNREKNKKRQN